jgi:hypothetical protein
VRNRDVLKNVEKEILDDFTIFHLASLLISVEKLT